MLPREIGTAIVGGGVVGLCLAVFLAGEGADVALVGDGRPGGTGANAGSLHVQMQSRFIRLHPEHVPALEQSLHLYPKAVAAWRALERELDADFELAVTGGLMVAESAEQFDFLSAKARRERALGLSVQMIGRAEIERVAPYLSRHVVGAELCAEEGKLNPLRCNAALRAAALTRGVALVEGVHVRRVAAEGGRLVLETSAGRLPAGRVVLAAAAGSAPLAAGLGVRLPARDEPLHMNVTEPTAALLGHLVQHADRQITLKQLRSGHIVIGGGWPARAADRHPVPNVDPASLVANVTLARHIAPALGPLRLIRTWAGLNTVVDGACVLGPAAAVPGLHFAIPGDAGYTLAPLVARLVGQSLLGRVPDEDLRPYAPERFAA